MAGNGPALRVGGINDHRGGQGSKFSLAAFDVFYI